MVETIKQIQRRLMIHDTAAQEIRSLQTRVTELEAGIQAHWDACLVGNAPDTNEQGSKADEAIAAILALPPFDRKEVTSQFCPDCGNGPGEGGCYCDED